MITAIRPHTPQNRQKQNFGAVHQNWVDKLVANPALLNNDFNDTIAFREISSTDAVDTLEAAKKKLPEGFQDAFNRAIDWARSY